MFSYINPKNLVLAICALNTRDTFKGRCSLFWPLILKAMLSGVIQKKLQMNSYIILKNFVLANRALNTKDTFKGHRSLFWPLTLKAVLSVVIQEKVANDFLNHS